MWYEVRINPWNSWPAKATAGRQLQAETAASLMSLESARLAGTRKEENKRAAGERPWEPRPLLPKTVCEGRPQNQPSPGPSINDRGPGIYSQKQKVGLSTVGGGKVATHAHRIEINLAVICYFFLSGQQLSLAFLES